VIHGVNIVALQRRQVAEDVQKAIKAAFKLLYRSGLTTTEALARIEAEIPAVPQVAHLVQFVRASERGILK
jgi:UDP-N-acetylglucosamine acyltransferase